ANPLARDGADQLLRLAGVADRAARRVDVGGERGVRDRAPAPERGEQILSRDDAVAILDEIDQEIEHERLDGNRLAAAGELPRIGVKRMIGKEKLHTLLRIAPRVRSSKKRGFLNQKPRP